MVRSRLFVFVLTVVFASCVFLNCAEAQWEYHLSQEWAKIWIREDGSIDLFYNISITLDSGTSISKVFVGQPNGDFTVGTAADQYNRTLSTSDQSSGSDYKVQVNLASPLNAGQTVWFTLVTNVARMIYEHNETYVGMKFIPTWWKDATVSDLRVLIVLPLEVQQNQIGTNVNWDNIQQEPDGRWTVFWQRQNLAPDQKDEFGVSFPKGFTTFVPKQTAWDTFVQEYLPIIAGFVIFGAIIVFIIIFARKKSYQNPTVSMETLGIRRGLTAVEASYLLEMKPPQIVTEILYSLLQKRAVWVESTKPSIKLRVLEPFQNKKGTVETPLRYYEIDFLDAVREDGSLDEERLAGTIMFLRDTVEEKMQGYERKDTVAYYKQIVSKAWDQVSGAGAPELASSVYDEQLLWLFLDPNYGSRTETVFQDKVFQPNPLWFWYWYGYTQYHPHPTSTPTTPTTAQTSKPPAIPGADFANNIATAVESTSNNFVVNLEKFANSILPFAPSKTSSQPAHRDASCVCACAACACACACVSCACACAGGGVGIKKGGLRP